MEGIVIFIIFIVFSVLRSLGESQQKQQGRGRGPASPPVRRPVRTGRPVTPRPFGLPQEYEDLVLEAEPVPEEEQEPVRKKPTLRKSVIKDRPVLSDDVHYAIKTREGVASLQFDEQALVQGFIFSEVLGAPRAKKPWHPRK